jgi:fatty-acyl-CoA synthase
MVRFNSIKTYQLTDTVEFSRTMRNYNIASKADIEMIEEIPFSQRFSYKSTYELIKFSAQMNPDHPAIRYLQTADPNETPIVLSYSDFLRKLHQAANLFAHLGIGENDVVSYLLPNLPQTHITIWGAEATGIVNPINPMLEPDVIADIMNEAGTKVIVALGPVCDSDIWQKLETIAVKVNSLQTILRVDPEALIDNSSMAPLDNDSSIAGVPVLDFDQAISKEEDTCLIRTKTKTVDSIAAYFHTGGTTGRPKIAQHTHINQVANASIFATIIGKDDPANFFVGLPLFHVNAVVATGLGVFASGGSVTLLTNKGYRNPQVLSNFWTLVDKYQATHFSCVPTVLTSLLNTEVGDSDISSLDFALCGAAPLSSTLFEAFENTFNVRILEGYGLTEGTCVSSLNPSKGERRIGSIGLRMPYQNMKTVILDADGVYVRDCDVDEVGVIVISGPNVFPGYKQMNKKSNVFVSEGWLNSGDLGRQDKNGYFWLTGRAKDLIIRGGHNIDPSTIESCLAKHPAIAEVAAIGQPDGYAGELPCAYVTLKPNHSVTLDSLKNHIKKHITERAAIPTYIEIIKTMPLTGVGKIFKPDLRRRAAERVLSDVLIKANIKANTKARLDEKRGLIVSILSNHTKSEIEKALKNFSIFTEIIDTEK